VSNARTHTETRTDRDMDALHSFACGAGRGRGRVSTNIAIVTEALKAMQSGAVGGTRTGTGRGGASSTGELPEGTVVVCISVCFLLLAVC
jgi:hypothetical protein